MNCEIISLFKQQMYVVIFLFGDYVLLLKEEDKRLFPGFFNTSRESFEFNLSKHIYGFLKMQPKLYKREIISEFDILSVDHELSELENESDHIKYVLVNVKNKARVAYLNFMSSPEYRKRDIIDIIHVDDIFKLDIENLKDEEFRNYIRSYIYLRAKGARFAAKVI